MAQSGFTPIKLYLSTTAAAVPLAADLAPGELAINNNDGKLFYEDSSGVVQVIATKAGASGDVVGPASATANAVPSFSGTTGKLIQNNSGVTIAAGVMTATGLSAAQVDITAQGDLRLQDTTGGEYVALQAPATIASSYTLTLPVDDGTAGQALVTDGSGVLSWSTAASGDVYGPASATDNAVARFDGTTGKIIQNSVVTIADTTGNMAGVGTLSSGAITSSALTSGRVPYAGTAGLIQDSANLTFNGTTLTNTGNAVISDNSANAALRITQVGAGNALLVEDSANPDATPTAIDADGRVGIGSLPVAGTNLYLSKSLTGGTLAFSMGNFGQIQSDVTSEARYFGTAPSTVAAAFTLSDLRHYVAFQGTFGAGSTVTNQMAFYVGANITGATNNYGFYSNIASGTGRYNFYAAGTANNYFEGSIFLAGSFGSDTKVGIGGTLPSAATNSYAYRVAATAPSASTANVQGFQTVLSTEAAAYTLTALTHFSASQGTIGATSAVTNQYGFLANTTLTGATNNYGFLGNIASGTGRFNFYANGTAANVFAGTTSLGGLVGAESLRATLVASAVNYLNVSGAVTTGFPSIVAAGSDTNIGIVVQTKGTGQLVTQTNSFQFQNTSGALQFFIPSTASSVNYLQVTGGIATSGPTVSTQGTDTNIAMFLSTKGAGQYFFASNSVTQFNISNTASAVNYLRVAGSITTAAPALSAQGSDTNIDLALTPKGTGVLAFGTYTAGILAQTGYITIKDAAGNTRNLLVG